MMSLFRTSGAQFNLYIVFLLNDISGLPTKSQLDAGATPRLRKRIIIMTTQFPRFFSFVLIIAAWQTYRIAGAIFWGGLDLSGGGLLPNAWTIPLWQDAATGLLAPFIVWMMAMRPNVLSYALGVSFFVFGIVDFTNGMVIEALYPPHFPPLGENMPDAFLTGWLAINLVLEIAALVFLLSPAMRRYFIEAEGKAGLSFKQSPMAGKWIWVLVFGALNGIFFKAQAAAMNAMFGMFN
jgi:hypothetical protein